MPAIEVPFTDALLVYGEELARVGPERRFLWRVRRGGQERPVRIRLLDQAAWALTPAPVNDANLRRAAAQLASIRVREHLGDPGFFLERGEFDVLIDTFHANMNEHGQLAWDPDATLYEA